MGTTEITAPPGLPFIEIRREFDAPRELLFQAHTDPDLFARWIGPRRLTTIIDVFEPRDGGRWRFVQREADGTEYAFHGVFHGLPRLDGILQTFEFEGWPGHVSLDSLRFEDLGDGRTRLVGHTAFQSLEARDAMIESGMEDGVNDGYAQLDELIATLQPAG
jgi:uncharacterized protein YndB with AHSA1/START domain